MLRGQSTLVHIFMSSLRTRTDWPLILAYLRLTKNDVVHSSGFVRLMSVWADTLL